MPWYVKDWLSSEDRARMTYEARGIYRELLDYAWLHHGLPLDKKELAQWLGITERKLALNWGMMAACWEERDGRLFNKKQDRVRRKLQDFHDSKSNNGRAGGQRSAATRRAADTSTRENTEQSVKTDEAAVQFAASESTTPDPSKSNLAFASSSSIAFASTTSTPATRSSPSSGLLMSPTRFEKLQQSHAFVGARLRIPNVLHAECCDKLGGVNPTMRLLGWYQDLNIEVEASGEPILDIFEWLRPRFKTWAAEAAADAELARYRPKEA
jgi:uncharacterized protein YdaU (DUF1376 family)